MLLKLRNNRRGDTIIEVMLCVAVVASVLGAAYATTARSVRLGRQAQERNEATEIAKGQADQLKHMSATNQVALNTGTRACIGAKAQPDGTLIQSLIQFSPAGGGLGAEPDLNADGSAGFTDYASQCVIGTVPYYTFFAKDSVDPRLYRIYVRWNRVGGGYEQVQISYRTYQGAP